MKLSPKETGNFDCAIAGKKANKNAAVCGSKGVNSFMAAYWPKVNSAEDEWSRVMFKFDLRTTSALPDDAYVTEATLGVRASEAALNTSGVEVGLVQRKVMMQMA